MKQGGWRKRASDRDGWGTWGGYMSAKVQKLENQFHSEAALQHQKDENSSSIFSGVAIFVNGFTDPSADELRRLMMLHGGQYHIYYSRSKTTHIIATNLPNAKIKELKGEKVVRPDWIIDSIKAGRLLSYIPYQLYTKQTSIQKGLWFNTICKPEDSIPGPSNISVGLNRVNSLVKKHEGENEMKTNGVSKSKKEAETTRFLELEQALSRSKQNGIHQKDNFSIFNGHSHSSNSALKMQDGLLHFDKSVISRLSPVQEELKESTDFRDCSTQHLQQSNRNTELLRNVHRTMSNSSFSSLHSNIKINGAHHYTVQGPSSTKSTTSIPAPSKEDYSPLSKPSNGNFISDFYSHSRLHHISTWKCEFTEFINTVQKQNNASFPGREKLKKMKAGQSSINNADLDSTSFLNSAKHQCCIMHVDMDCFFVSVGIRDRPDLKGKPVAVTSNRGSGKALLRPGANPQLERQYYQNKLLKSRTELVLASDFSIRCSTFTMRLSSFPTFDERFSTLPSSEKNVSSIAPELHEVTSST